MRGGLVAALPLFALACAGEGPAVVSIDQPPVAAVELPAPAAPTAEPSPAPAAPPPPAKLEERPAGVLGILKADDGVAGAFGSLSGGDIGEAFGAGGLGLQGVGPGGGGIGLGSLGKLGHGAGAGAGGKKPRITGGPTPISGRLSPQAVKHVSWQNGRWRLCYERALATNPKLAGRVVVKFVIGLDGAVASASDAGSTLPDKAAVACIVRTFYGLSFPQPEGGLVTVTYPITLSPGDWTPSPPPPPPTVLPREAEATSATPKR